MKRSLVFGHPRAAIVIDGHAEASIQATQIAVSNLGLVLQGGAKAARTTTLIHANEAANLVTNGQLTLPPPPTLIQ